MRLEWTIGENKETLELKDPEYFIGSHSGCQIRADDSSHTIYAAVLKAGDTYEVEPRELESIGINGEVYTESVPLFGSLTLTVGGLEIRVIDDEMDETEDEGLH